MTEIISLSFFFLQSPQKSQFYLMQTLASPFREQRCHHINHQMIFYMPRVFSALCFMLFIPHISIVSIVTTRHWRHILPLFAFFAFDSFSSMLPDIIPKPNHSGHGDGGSRVSSADGPFFQLENVFVFARVAAIIICAISGFAFTCNVQ